MTNGDRIRSMSDDELAKFLSAVTCNSKGWCPICTSMYGDYCNGLKINVDKRIYEFIKNGVKN